ncbi:MAG: MFS transporter, partial [Desulfobacterales bacterium]|nr:MFS transporter [Desulfobacterales bacterium]
MSKSESSILHEVKVRGKKQVQKSPSSSTIKMIIVSSAHGMHDTYSGFIAPLLPFLIERLSLLKAEAGLFILIFQGASILQPIIGHIGDRRNLRKYALVAPAVTGIFLSLLGTAPSFSVALLYCLIAGISSAALHATLPALVSSFSGENIGKGMGIWMVGGELGVMLGPILITAVVTTFSMEATPWLMIGGFVVSVLLSFLLKDLPFHNSVTNQQIKIPVKELTAILLPIAGITVTRSILRTCSVLYLPVFLTDNGSSIWFAGISLSIAQGIGILGTISGGLLNDRLGYKITIILSLIVSAIAMIFFSRSQGITQIIILAILSISSLMILPVGMAIVQKSFPKNRSLANGLYLALLFGINAL